MFYKSFLLKYGEIGVKGKNRDMFEEALISQIRLALKKVDGKFTVRREAGRVFVETDGDYDYDGTVNALKKVFGVVGICPVMEVPDRSVEAVKSAIVDFVHETYQFPVIRTRRAELDKPAETEKKADVTTFKVRARRPDKHYPVSSMEMNAILGEEILNSFTNLEVDVHEPDITIYVELREQVYIYSKIIPGPGGMPIGTNGKSMLLLSGGIDSPVAGWMIAKRGVRIDATYFHAPPYTSERAKQKVIDLAKIVSEYSGPISLHIVNFTDIQLAIYEKCPHDELTIIMRRYMMRIAETIAKESDCQALITGESIGQVASQTVPSLVCTDEVCTVPVFRPLIGFDKQDIIDISLKIGTYDTSILPYEDCCTIFVAKHPVTRPKAEAIRRSEEKLQGVIDDLVQTALDTAETILVG